MKITSIDELHNAAVGTTVTYGETDVWTKRPDSKWLHSGGTVVAAEAFTPAIAAGLVLSGGTTTGKWSVCGYRYYYGVTSDVYAVLDSGGSPIADEPMFTRTTRDVGDPIDRPAWADSRLETILQKAGTAWATSDEFEVPHSLVTALHETAEALGDPAFDAMLTECKIGREKAHATHVTVTGTIEVTPAVPGLDLEAKPVTVPFSTVALVVKNGIGCVCDQIGEADVLAQLPEGAVIGSYVVACAA